MSPQSWETVKRLFDEALNLPAEARSQCLDSAGADSEERRLLEGLLRQHDRLGDFLEQPVLDSQSTVNGSGGAHPATPSGLHEGLILRRRYRIERELGRGGNGIVYLARDEQLSARPVVVKLLHTNLLEDPWRRSIFRREMEALSRIDHPAVVGVLDVWDDPAEPPFLVMQYVDGVTLRSELAGGPLSFDRAATILTQTGAALDAAHASGVAHRDLKPENIMIQKSSQGADVVRLIDFGIAKVESKTDVHTTTLVLVGTTRYMAPEQLLGKASYASDIYALGVVACELLTGRCPYQSESAFDLLEAQISGNPASLRKLRPDLPVHAERLILRALSFHPESRPRHAGAFARDLAGALTKPFGVARRAKAAIAAAVIAAAILLAAVLLWNAGFRTRTDAALERVLEKRNSTDPADDGFSGLHDNSNEIFGEVAFNPANSGYEGWRVSTHRQGFYTRNLTGLQTDAALVRGWKMSEVSRVTEGGAFVIVAFEKVHRRFDIFTFLDENGDTTVRLITSLLPSLEGPEYHLKGSGTSFHQYELIYNPALKRAELFVDSVPRLSGYAGHTDYADHSWFVFGPHLYRSRQAVATFQTLRFEINP